MTTEEKLTMLRAIGGWTDDDNVLSAFLKMARSKILARCYPYESDYSELEMPARYDELQVQAANYYLNKRGAEGETGHSENATQVQYSDGDLPQSLLREIMPIAKAVVVNETTV